MKSLTGSSLLLFMLLMILIGQCGAQSVKPVMLNSDAGPAAKPIAPPLRDAVPQPNPFRSRFTEQLQRFEQDQKAIWTAPSDVRVTDMTWIVPLAGISTGLFVSDRQYSASLPQRSIHPYQSVSNLGVAALAGTSAGLYLGGFATHNAHWSETGFLAGEAAVNSLITTAALKYTFRRERPLEGDGSGRFLHGGTSFPSGHAAAAWSIAGVIAHEYPGTLPRLLAYGAASAVSISRVKSRQHFPSDVLVGSALGYLIAQSVYRRGHDAELGGSEWQSPPEMVREPRMRTPSYMGSPYVPLDSWIYSAFERLAALGYLNSSSLGIRPWTRLECARLLSEASELESDGPAPARELFEALSDEFAPDFNLLSGERNVHAQLESVYQRSLFISGEPLTDGYHFGQTRLNDFGRPYQEGFNNALGTSAWAVAGPFVFYTRGEYQYAPSGPSVPAAALNVISTEDFLPPDAPSVPTGTISRFRLLDAYVGMNLSNWQLSFGQQSLWWGPSDGGATAFTNNAAPIRMFRVNRVSPFQLPGPLRTFGDLRLDFFLGQLQGQDFINNGPLEAVPQGQYGMPLSRQPFLSGGRISFKFTPNFEFSMSKTTVYGGPGNPLTPTTLVKSALGYHVNTEPMGDGRSVADFSYRIPKLRNWLTVYGEGFSEDEVSPLNTPQKSVWQGGLYASHLPSLDRVDLRIEGGFTSPVDFPTCNGCFYHNFQYVNGYTNDGQLMGSWIGRAAQGELLRSNYWLAGNKKLTVEFRHRKIDRQFIPQGGTQNDAAFSADLMSRSGLRFSANLQYERWQIPVLSRSPQSNVSASFQFGYWPPVRVK